MGNYQTKTGPHPVLASRNDSIALSNLRSVSSRIFLRSMIARINSTNQMPDMIEYEIPGIHCPSEKYSPLMKPKKSDEPSFPPTAGNSPGFRKKSKSAASVISPRSTCSIKGMRPIQPQTIMKTIMPTITNEVKTYGSHQGHSGFLFVA